MTAMMILVIVGNMLVIIAIATENNLTSVQNWFIASLAFADLSLGLIIMPFSLAQELLGYWMFGSVWCDMHAALDVLLSTSSIMNLCLISLDRYWSITRALDYLNNRTQPRVLVMIITVWLLSAFISIPPLLGWKQAPDISWFDELYQKKEDLNLTSQQFGELLVREMSYDEFTNFTKTLEDVVFPKCQVSDEVGYVIYSALGSFYIPSCIMVFVYIKIYYAARARARRHIKPKPSPTKMSNLKEYSMQLRQGDLNPWKHKRLAQAKSYPGTVPPTDPALINGKPKKVLLGLSEEEKELCKKSICESMPLNGDTDINGVHKEGVEGNGLGATPEEGAQCVGGVMVAGAEGGAEGVKGERRTRFEEDENQERSSSDSSFDRCGPMRPGSIFHKLRLGRRLSKEAREMIDIGKVKKEPVVKTVSRPEENGLTSIERDRRKLARKKERRATLILGLIMGAFIACWLPFFILYLIGPVCPVCQPGLESSCCVESWSFSFAFWLGYSNSALNPVIYTVFNQDFRKAFKKILFK